MAESVAFKEFLEELTQGGSPRTVTYGLGWFRQLEGDERIHAITLLLRGAVQGDIRAIETLGQGNAREVAEQLETLRDREGEVGAAAARALLNIRRFEREAAERAAEVAAVRAAEAAEAGISLPDEPLPEPPPPDTASVKRLGEAISTSNPVTAAMNAFSLRNEEGDEALRGLLAALESDSIAARANGWLGLRDKLDLEPLLTSAQAPLWALVFQMRCQLDAVWKPAAATMRERLTAYAMTRDPDASGLAYVCSSERSDIEAFATSAEGRTPKYDTEALQRLRGHDRQWAIAVLLSDLWMKPAAGAVLVELRLPQGLEALREAAGRAFGPLQEQFAADANSLAALLPDR